MSLLPQRKKSHEEIAKLRESLGIPGQEPEVATPPSAIGPSAIGSVKTLTPTHHEAIVVAEPEKQQSTAKAPPPAAVHLGAKPVHSFKKSERIPILPAEVPAPVEQPVAITETQPTVLKAARSLRKSEQGPIHLPLPQSSAPHTDSKLPVHRHDDKELNEIRRREALAMLNSVANPKLAAAHFSLLVPGYLLAIIGATCFIDFNDLFDIDYQFPMAATAGCAGSAMLVAAFIFIRRPISRHHAAFIAVISLFVIVFGALIFFPNLLHAT